MQFYSRRIRLAIKNGFWKRRSNLVSSDEFVKVPKGLRVFKKTDIKRHRQRELDIFQSLSRLLCSNAVGGSIEPNLM